MQRLTKRPDIWKNFPHLILATSDTPSGRACLIPSNARRLNSRTCVFVLNSPDVRAQTDLTEPEVRAEMLAACQRSGCHGLSFVMRQTHNVFVAFFSNSNDADRARKRVRLSFQAAANATPSPLRLYIKAESHHLQVNDAFYWEDAQCPSVNHDTVARRIFEALGGPLISHLQLLKLELMNKQGHVKRTRYLLRSARAVSPIFVERFYIPLDSRNGVKDLQAIFKPYCRSWQCPGCHKSCQQEETSTCPSAIELPRVFDATR